MDRHHTWGKRIADELTLVTVRLVPSAGFKNVSLVVQVEASNPAHDPRLVILARRAIALKHSDHILLDVSGQRFLLRLGEECVVWSTDRYENRSPRSTRCGSLPSNNRAELWPTCSGKPPA